MRSIFIWFAAALIILAMINTGCHQCQGSIKGKYLEFKITSLEGDVITDEDTYDQAVLFFFLASWCKACKPAIPDLKKIYKEYRDDDFEIYAVVVRDNKNAARKLKKKYKMPFPVVFSDGRLEKATGGGSALPTFVVVDRDGLAHNRIVGYRGDLIKILKADIDTVLNQPVADQ